MAREELKSFIAEANEEMFFIDGFHDAIIGYVEKGATDTVALYDKVKCIHILMDQGMTEDEAVDFFYYNVLGTSHRNMPAFATFVSEGDI